jgi:hypothetical protein
MQAPPEPKHTPPWTNVAMQHGNATKSKTCSLCPGRLDRLSWAVRLPLCGLTACGRLDRPKRLALHQTFQKLPKPLWTPSKCS